MPDIDIDLADRTKALDVIRYISASRIDEGTLVKHNTGIYLHPVPVLADKNICEIDHESAQDLGYFKIDFLNVSVYRQVKDEDHLDRLMSKEPIWELLEQAEFVDLLFHVNNHIDILRKMKPNSLEKLAAVLAMIRPSKRYLVGKDWSTVLKEVWIQPSDGSYHFKKSHATAYAMAVCVQMNLICEQIESGDFPDQGD
jgi:DNA polymerase III alpha subunit